MFRKVAGADRSCCRVYPAPAASELGSGRFMRARAASGYGIRIARFLPMISVVRDFEASKAWDRFVEQQPRATVAHLAAWGEIDREAYGHERIYLTAHDPGGDVAGVLPLALGPSPGCGDALVPLAFLYIVLRAASPCGGLGG